jgi:hypothetical protein
MTNFFIGAILGAIFGILVTVLSELRIVLVFKGTQDEGGTDGRQ